MHGTSSYMTLKLHCMGLSRPTDGPLYERCGDLAEGSQLVAHERPLLTLDLAAGDLSR